MKEVGVVILSRFNSRRLYGKALIEIEGKPVLKHIHDSISTLVPSSMITIATSAESSDNPIEEFCLKNNINCYRGSLTNVAERFSEAGMFLGCDYITRINGDNIFIDLALLESMIGIAKSELPLFISNVKGRTYPKGMSIEIVLQSHYNKLLPKITSSEYHKEHITSYLYENILSNYRFVYNTEYPELAGVQLALDDHNDLARTRNIFKKLEKPVAKYGLRDIYEIINSLNNTNE